MSQILVDRLYAPVGDLLFSVLYVSFVGFEFLVFKAIWELLVFEFTA